MTEVQAEADVRALLELGDAVRESLNPDSMRVCPIRDCPGGEGPHGSIFHGPGTWLPEKGGCE